MAGQMSILARYFLRLFICFWVVLFFLKIFFILRFATFFSLNLFGGCLVAGWKFDFGVIFAACILQCIMILFSNKRIAVRSLFVFQVSILILFFILDCFLYASWGATFNIRALKYMTNMRDVFALLSLRTFFVLIILILGISFIATKIFAYIMDDDRLYTLRKNLLLPIIIVLFPLCFLILRGGFREIPINQSDAFYCREKVYNLAALNSTWNFFSTWLFNKDFVGKQYFFKVPSSIADSIVHSEFRSGKDLPMSIFNQLDNPNIILITMEGINAQLLRTYNGSYPYMPFLDSLIDSSYSFSKCYSVGFRTEQGLAAMLSGSLSTPYVNLTDNINNLPDMPSLLEPMKSKGYYTQFVFGGNIEFANMKAYLRQMGFDKIIDILDFQKSERTQNLGVEDKYLFARAYKQIMSSKKPYFLQIMTQSTHEPYDVACAEKIMDEDGKYKRTAQYLDTCIQKFIGKLSAQNKLENTVVIITSDHAHKYPDNYKLDTPLRFHIPFIIYSKHLQDGYKGYKDQLIFSQANVPMTMKHLFGWQEWKPRMPYSLNHFSTSRKSAFMTFVTGYVYLNDSQYASHEYVWGNANFKDKKVWNNHLIPLSIMQTLVKKTTQPYSVPSHKVR